MQSPGTHLLIARTYEGTANGSLTFSFPGAKLRSAASTIVVECRGVHPTARAYTADEKRSEIALYSRVLNALEYSDITQIIPDPCATTLESIHHQATYCVAALVQIVHAS